MALQTSWLLLKTWTGSGASSPRLGTGGSAPDSGAILALAQGMETARDSDGSAAGKQRRPARQGQSGLRPEAAAVAS